MKKSARKLTIHAEAVRLLRTLRPQDLAQALGGDAGSTLGGMTGRDCPAVGPGIDIVAA